MLVRAHHDEHSSDHSNMRKHKYAKVIADIQMLLTALEYIDGQYRVVRLHLKKWRDEQGLSLKTLSSKTRPLCAPESINQIEEGRVNPSPEFLSAMVKLIDQSDKQQGGYPHRRTKGEVRQAKKKAPVGDKRRCHEWPTNS